MDQMLQQFWDSMKGKGKGGKSNKRQKTQKVSPWKRLLLASSKLSMGTQKQMRQLKGDLTHSAMFTNPFPEELKAAVDTTAATRGTDRRQAAKATWMSACQGLASSKRKSPPAALATMKKHVAEAKDLEEHILECRAAVTYNQTMMLLSWWTRDFQSIESAFQELLVAIGAEIKHGPAPAFGPERETAEAYAAAVATMKSTASGSDDF